MRLRQCEDLSVCPPYPPTGICPVPHGSLQLLPTSTGEQTEAPQRPGNWAQSNSASRVGCQDREPGPPFFADSMLPRIGSGHPPPQRYNAQHTKPACVQQAVPSGPKHPGCANGFPGGTDSPFLTGRAATVCIAHVSLIKHCAYPRVPCILLFTFFQT